MLSTATILHTIIVKGSLCLFNLLFEKGQDHINSTVLLIYSDGLAAIENVSWPPI